MEENFNFKVETFLTVNGGSIKGLGYTGLALVSTQKIMLFLGDLARYREVANDSNNYGKSKQWVFYKFKFFLTKFKNLN